MAQKNKYSGRKLKKPNMRKEGNFTMIPNAFILNPNIKNPELRLLSYIMMYDDNRRITTKNCMKYLSKSKPTIISSFEKLIELSILKITDEHIEVEIPEEMKKYTLGYSKGKENITTEVKKTLPSNKDNFTSEVKKTDKKPLDNPDNEVITNPIILDNTTRVLPVLPTGESTEQSHSNNTNSNTGLGLDLERDSLQSQASPSVLAPSLHTPKIEVEKESKESPIQNSISILYNQCEALQSKFQDASLTLNDVNTYLDSDIAKIFLSNKLSSKVSSWSGAYKNLNYNFKHYGVIVYACKYALELELDLKTNLKTELELQSKMTAKQLYKLIYGYDLSELQSYK